MREFSHICSGLEEAKSRKIKPLPAERVISPTAEEKARWYEIGLDHIARGKVGVLLLAGGQGQHRHNTSDVMTKFVCISRALDFFDFSLVLSSV
jgi:hypothetical protein